MRIALYAGEGQECLTSIFYSPDHLHSPYPWRVDVVGVVADRQYKLLFQAVMIHLCTPFNHVVKSYVAVPASPETDDILRTAFAGAEIPNVPPQHRERFVAVVRQLLQAKG